MFERNALAQNFDKLLEKAVADEGITPQVICHEDDIEGAVPLVHSSLTIVKINGDYIDCRFRNTAEELDAYPPKLYTFLSRIFSEFGLITCGWSATWDKGLTDIIRNIENRRYAILISSTKKVGMCSGVCKEQNQAGIILFPYQQPIRKDMAFP